MGLLDALKNAVLEDDGKPEPKTEEPAPSATITPHPTTSAPAMPTEGGDIYAGLLAKTDYRNTPVGTIVHKYLDGLAGLPLDDSIKLKTAIAQAKKIDGIVDDGIIGSFEAVKGWLKAEEDDFSEAASATTASEIVDRQKRIEVLNSEVKERQEALVRLAQELSEAQSRLSTVSMQFKSAVARRTVEIEQELARYTAAVKG